MTCLCILAPRLSLGENDFAPETRICFDTELNMVLMPHQRNVLLAVTLQLGNALLLPALGEVVNSCSEMLVRLERYSDQELQETCEALFSHEGSLFHTFMLV
eukprot:symbB.v1.2.025943.t1/scaffold2554.1/size89898/5